MNDKFREYAFGRAFTIHLTEQQIKALADLCKGDVVASYGMGGPWTGLHRRGLVENFYDGSHARTRPTKAGLLVYDLLVEAGEYAALQETRRKTLDLENELHAREWEERYGQVTVQLKERFRRDQTRDGQPQ